MNKNIKLQELKRWLKSSLKNKVSINDKTVIAFLMTGFLGLSTVAKADYVAISGSNSTLKVGRGVSTGRGVNPHNNIPNGSIYLTDQGLANGSTFRGTDPNVVLIGRGATAMGSQATAVGNNTGAAEQGTAIGSDVFAGGFASIAIGNDDITSNGAGVEYYTDTLPTSTINRIYKHGNDRAVGNAMSWSGFSKSYLKDGDVDKRIYSPTFARGVGSIAIGSRTVAYGDGSTSLGTLSFALGERSTAVGIRAFTNFDATGSTAIGEEARTFASNTISIGNKTEATNVGSLAFGNLSRAVGKGSIAIGESVASNALLEDNRFNLLKSKIDHYTDFANYKSGNENKLVDAGFASKQNQKLVGGYINSIINDIGRFTYQSEGDLVIKTTENIYKTKKIGDHAISLGYYLVNTGDNTVGIGTASRIHGANSVAIGALNVIDGNAANSIAIGVGTRVEKENTLAFGTGALGLGAGSIILGAGAYGSKDNTIAIGYGAESKSLGSLSLGSGTKVAENSNSSLAIGNNSSIGTKSANSTAIGIGAKVADNTQQGMAIGNDAEANLVNSTALGFESRTDYSLTDLSEPGYTPRGSYTIPTSARTGIISVGRIGEERRITNLASGFRDTDAVNVAQLRALEDRFEFSVSGFDDKTINYVSINSDGGDAGRVKEIALREVQYKEYVKLKKLEATLEVRKQSGDNLDQSKVQELFNRIRELENGTNGQRFKTAAINLIDTIGKIKRTNNNPYFTNGQSGANFKRDEAYAHIDRDEATANNNISSIVSDDERNITKDTNFDNKGAKSADALSIGYKAFVEEGSENSIAIGKESKINKNTTNSVAIGYKASAGVSNNNPVTDAIAIGQQTKAQGNYSVVLGYKSQVDNLGGIAIGKEAKTHESSASAIAIGDGAEVKKGANSIAIGSGASVKVDSGNANHSVAIGNASSVTGGYSVAVGKSSKATDTGTSAFGENSKATAERATAIGNNSNAAGKNAVALAFQASASGENSTALGHKANTSATNATALGANSSASIDGSVAIGAYSEATVNKDVNGYDPETNANSTNNNATWKATNAAVSVGHRRSNNEITRQITNVAAGTHDTDAVNVAQLRKLRDAAVVKYFSVKSTQNGNKNNDGAIHNDTVAIGPNAKAEGHNSIAIGHNATTQNGASFAIGYDVTVRGDNSIGIGKGINFTEDQGAKPDYTVAIGSDISIGKHSSYSVAIGKGAKITHVGSTVVGESAKAENDRATSIGNNTSTTVISGIALGYQSVSNRALNDNATTGYDILADGGKATPDAVWKATHGALSIGDTGKTRQITNVAAGRADTDAVNVAQLKQVKLQYRSQNSTGNASSKQSATIAQGLLFKSGSNELKINAKANGEVEFKVELPTSPDNKLTFKAENSTEFERKNSQDKKVEIVSGDFSVSQGAGAGVNYKAKNLATKLDTTTSGAAIKIGLKDEVEFTKVSINSGTAQGPTLSTSGIDMGNKNISNLSKGTANDHAVRFDQLKELDGVTSDKILSKLNKGNVVAENGLAITGGTGTNRLLGTGELKIGLDTATKAKIDALPDDLPENIADATKSITFKASNDGTTFVRTNNQDKTLTVTEGNIGADYVGTNLKTSIDTNGNLKIGFKKAATFDSVSIPNGPSLSSTGLNMGGKPISNLGDASGDKDAPTYKQLKDLVGVLESTVTSKVQKGNLVAEDGIQINDGSGTDRLIGTGTLKVGLTQATKNILAKVGTGVISTTDPNKANTVTGEAVQNALNNLTIKYNDGKQGSVAKASKLSDGLKFVSKSDNLTIEAKDGGSIEFTITDELDKDLTDLTDDGKNVIKNQAIQAVKVVKDTTNTGNPITVTEDDTVANTKTYKIGIDNDKLKAAVGLPTGTVTKDSKDAVTGGKIFDAIKTAKTLVDKKDGETFITVEKTEPEDSIEANSYKIGLNITPLSAELAKTFAKQDASNITDAAHKTAWRNALNVYDKPEVDAKVKAATEKVENAANSILTVSDEAGVDGLGKTYKVGLTADKVKEVAGTDTLGNLGVDENDLTITGDGANRLLGAGNVSISLSQAVKQTLGKVGTGVISGTDANKDKTVTGKVVYDYVKANVGDKAITFSADNTDATYIRENSETGAVSIKSGAVDTDFVGENLKTKIDTNGNILVGFRKAPKFESIVVGTNADNAQNISINNNGIDLKERGITGLVKGKADNEAVNVSQLRPFATALGGGAAIDANGDLTQPTYALKAGNDQPSNYTNVGAGLKALDDAIVKIKDAEFTEKGKEDVRDLAREAVKVKADDQVKNNPIKVRADKTATENTTYNISIDIDKLKQEAGLSSGEVADGDNDTVTGDKVYDAVKNAKTLVDKKDGEQYISVDKTEPNDISANSYKIGLNLNPLTTKLGETFVKLDGSNLDSDDKKAAFRNAINVYDKTHVDNLTVKYTDGGAQSTPKTTKLTDGFKFSSTNEKLTVTAKDNGEISLGLNLPDDIPTEVADGTKTFTVKASVLEGTTNPAGYVKTNNDDRALTFIEGDITTGAGTNDEINYRGANLKTSLSPDGTIKIGFKEMPTFKGTIFDPVGDGSKTITMTPTADGSGVKFEKSPEDPKGDKRVTIEGVKDGTSPDSVVTKGTFDKIVGRDGKDGTNGTDGRNGSIGLDGRDVPERNAGAAGKDGLNGTSVNEKANALRRGEAGPVVYTAADGTRIAKANDGKLYNKENVTPNGDLTAGDYVKVKQPDGQYKYYNKDQIDSNGELIDNAQEVAQDKLAEAMAAFDNINNVDPNTVVHSLVNIDGETKDNPSILSNIASGIGEVVTSEAGVAPEVKFTTGSEDASITPDKATKVTEALLGIDKKAKLNTAATVGDLQAVAKAGLNFKGNVATGNNEAKTHRALTETLEIVGKDGETSFDDYTTNNVATKVSSGKIEIGFRKAPKFDSITIGTNTDDSKNVSINDNGIAMGNKKITGLAKGTANTDAVTKEQLQYVLSKLGGGTGTTEPTIDGTGEVTGPVYKLMAGEKQPTDVGAAPITKDYANVGEALKALDTAIEHVKNAEFTDKGKEDVRDLAREAVKVKAKDGINNAIIVNPIKTDAENTTYELFVEKTDSIEANAGTLKDPAPADQDENPNHPNRLVTEKAVVDYVATKVTPVSNNKLTFGADNTDTFERKNSEDKAVSIKATNDAITVGTSTDKYLGNNLTTKLVAAQDGKSAEILIGLKESPQFKDVFATEKIAIGTPTQSGPALTKDGIDGGNKPVFNVAKGVNNDDVITVSQLKPLLDRLGATLKTDGTDDNGQKDQNGTVTAPTFDLKTGALAPDTTKAYGTVGDALKALDEKLSQTATGTSSLTFSDGNAANNFVRENNEDKTVTITKADNEKNVSVALSKNQDGTVGTFKVALANDLKEITSITNGDGTNPDTKSKIALADDSVKVSVQGKDLTITKVGEQGKEGISLTGLEERDIDSDNYGIDANKTRAATEGAVKHLSDVLGGNVTIVNKIGPAGKDGLDGKTIVEKVEGLRDGQSGPIVYTDQNGNRLIKDPKDGKYYVMKQDGTKDENQEVDQENVRLSMVDPAGETTEPITIGNLASALGLDKVKADGSGNYTKPISNADAKDVIGGLLTKDTDLNRAVTLSDLQALAVAGLDFEGNTTLDGAQNVTNNTTRRKLSEKLTIIGKEQVASFDTYSTDNLATRVSEGKIEIGMLKTPRFDALELGAKGTNPDKKITLTPDAENGKLTLGKVTDPAQPNATNPEKVILEGLAAGEKPDSAVTKAQLDELAKKVGGTEEDVTDGRNGSNGLDGEKVQAGNAGAAGKDGLNGKDLNEKVNALRRGEAGPVVYTTEDGERLVKGLDGKLYKPEEIKDKVFVEGKGYVAEADKDDENATPVEAYALSANKDKVRHSLVNIDGSTTEPSVLANVASGIGKVVTSEAGVAPEVTFTTGSENAAITPDKADKVTKSLLGIDTKAKLNTAATVGDLQAVAQAGLDFKGNVGDNEATTHRTLASTLQIVGTDAEVANFDATHSTINVATKVSDGKIEVGFRKTPEFEALKLKSLKAGEENKAVTLTPSEDGEKLTIKGPNGPVELDGIKAGTSPNSAVNKAQLDELANKLGDVAKDGEDGRNGSKGLDGQAAPKGDVGPAGRDGLNGKDLNEKVNALRRGEAGAIVYTDLEGNRLVKGLDGKLYKADELENKVYVDGTGYVDEAKADKQKDGTYTLKPNEQADAVEAFNPGENNENVRLSGVNIDGSTNTPTELANIASGLGLNGKKPNSNDNFDKPISKEDAKAVIAGDNGLVELTEDAKLNKVATVRDLQALAISGLEFGANTGDPIHRTLGTKIDITGKKDNQFNEDEHSFDNVVTKIDTEDDANAIRIAFAKKPKFEEIKLQGPGQDKPVISIKPTDDGIKFTKDPANPDDKVVVSGVKPGETEDSVATKGEILEIIKEIGGIGKDGKDGKDGRDGSKGLDGKDTENFGPAGKDGLNGQPIHERVNALRRGEAGPVVYTDPDGNRLIKGYDGKLYKQQDLVDKVYVENVGFIPKDQAEKKPDGTYIVKADVDAPTVTDPFALTEHADKVKHSLVNIDGTTTKPSKLSNLADGEISATSSDAINGSQLFKLVGDSTKDGKDGRNGDNGLDGAPAADKDAGLAGKDGLNGKDLNEKVNALRRGEAGAIVFTKDDGTRLAKANDGKLYDKENVTASGDLTAEDYVKVGDEYFKKDQLDENGKVLPGEVAINDQAEIEKAKEAIDALTSTDANDVVHSLVNIDGTTNNPSVLKNIASGINPEIIGIADEAISLENANKVISGDPADDQDKGLLGLADKAKLNTAATVGDLQALAKAGLNFAGNVGDSTHRSLTETLTIVGTSEAVADFDTTHSTINVATKVSDGKIEVGFRKTPEFEALKLKSLKAGEENKAVTLTPSEDGEKLTIKGPNGPVELDGIKAGTSPNSAVNKAQLDELTNKLGDVAKDGEDGRNGSKGLDGLDAPKGDVGPAGRDGLNGKDLNEKVNALRRGEAGVIVYTDLEGNRLVKGLDGKLYKADELENKVYVDGTGYVDEAKAEKEQDGTYTLLPGEQADAVEAFNPGENNENVRLSGVNIDGSTDKPTELANIASGLGLNGKKPNSNDNYAKPITIEEAQGVVAGNNDNPGGLVGLTDDTKLNKVATVRDLQALAISGLEFGANGDQKIHRTLGTKIDITGKKDNTFSEDKFSFDNVVTKVDTESTNNAIRIAIAKVPRFDALELGAKPLDENTPDSKITITPNTGTGTISFKNDPGIADPNNTGNPADTKVVIDGIKDGNTPDSAVTKGTVDKIIELVGGSTKDGEDGRNGINGLDGNKVQDGNAGAAGKDGLNGKDLNEKVNALRRGEAGPVVYTTEDGERLVKGFDGKLYKPEDIKDKVFVEGVGYVNETDAKLENGVYVLADNVEEDTVDKVEAYALEANKDKVRHSLVNIDGETTNPSILSNVASGIDHKAIGIEDKAITVEKAKENVDKLLSLDKMSKLNTAATVGDLQALAQAGMNFGANSGDDIHRTLGAKLSIVGYKDEFARINALEETEKATELAKYLAKFTDKNVITTTNNDEISIKLAERPEFKGIDVVDEANGDNKVSIDPTGTTVIGKDGNNFVRTITGKDGVIVKKTSDESGNTDLDPKEEAKYGLGEASIQKGDKKVTINPEEIVISDTSANDPENAGKLKLTKDKVAIEDENGTETASLKGANGENGATLELKDKDGENGLTLDGGKGTITGISDVNDETPDDAAVNKKYVDTLAKSSKTEIESIDGSVNIEERRDDVNNNIIYDISVNKGTLSVTPEGEVSADKTGNAFVTAENAADAINKAAKAAKTEITTADKSVLIDETTGINGNNIYDISIKKDGKVEEGNDDLVTGDTVAKALDKAAKAAKTEVEAGKNVVVKERQGDNGQTIYEVSTVDRPEFKEINLKDPEKPGKESTLGPDRIVVGAEQPNGKKKETIIDADGIRVKDEEGHVAKIEPTEISLGNEGEDPTVRLKAQDGDNPASLELGRNNKGEPAVKIDSANGLSGAKITLTDATGDKKIELDASKGTITGIEDATDETPASAVVNKNYVDSKLDGLGANRPFEYRSANDTTKVVVKGKDGKLYLEEEIKDKVFVEGKGYVAKDLATRDELGKWNLKDPNADNKPVKALNSDDVVITAMPQDKPLTVTNIRDGKIAKNSTDAINGSQLNDLATKLGLEVVKDGENKDKLFKDPEFEILKDEKGKVLENNKSTSLKDAIAKNITKLNSGLSLGADLVDDTAKDAKQYLGSKINVKAGSFEIGDVKYSDSNIKTKYTYDSETGEGTINIGITEKPVFEEVKANKAVKVADDILLVKGSEDNKPTLAFTKGNGQILGLSNADDTTPDNAAVNKKYVDSKVAKIDGVSSGIANAIALANLTQVQHRGGYRHQISGGYGTYNGEHAFGLGLSGISKGGQIMYKVSGSLNTRGKFAAGVGIGYQFDKEEIIEDELVTELRNQAKKSKEETDKLRNELDANSKETNKLRNELNANIKEIRELKEELTNLTKQVSKNYKELKQDMYMVNAYDVDSYTLNDRQIRELKAIIADLNENHKNKIIDVTGYADITSNEKYNLEIGLDRARFVVEKLIEFGLDESIVIRKVSSYGHNSIIDTNGNQKGRLTNRRVEISVK